MSQHEPANEPSQSVMEERPTCKACGADVTNGPPVRIFVDDPSVPGGIYCTDCVRRWENDNIGGGDGTKPGRAALMSERERDAVELLDRIYGRKAGHQLSDSGMFEEWADGEIMAFIRKHGAFKDQFRGMTGEPL